MTERLDALMTRSYQQNGETKTAYTKVGTAWALSGGGFRLKLEAVPVPTIYDNKVECSLLLVPPRDRDASQSQDPQRPSAGVPPAFDGAGDDSVPF